MTTQIVRNLSVALFAAATLFAQGSQTLTVQVPFGFHVGNSVLPAGGYTVYIDGPSHIVRLTSDDSKSSAMIQSHGVEKLNAPSQGMLVFSKYGDEYFLSQVWRPGNNTGRELQKTKREFEVAAIARRGTESVIAKK
jgi:hypothetical protein